MRILEIPSGFSPEERSEKARALFKEGYNCSQAVVLAFSDIIDMKRDDLIALSSGFGGGMGRMREVCGTVSGMTFMAGLIIPADATDMKAKSGCYALVQEMADEFRRQNGSIICRELLGLAPMKNESPIPSPRTPEYYKKRPCEELCAIAAAIVAKRITMRL